MQFTQLNLDMSGSQVKFNPYDRGANGAFVYRMDGLTLQAPRLVINTVTDDNASDKYSVQVNHPRMSDPQEGCCDIKAILGTDLVKTELRFLATTSSADRNDQIDMHIAALQELRGTFSNREKIYS